MKIVKPQRLGLVTRCFEHERRFFLGMGVLTLHRFEGGMASEMEMWPFLAGELGQDGVPDSGMPKSRAEFLVSGSAFSPTGSPQPSCTVQARVGSLEKTLWVYGDRFWTIDDRDQVVVTSPEPFLQMPLGWERAFGGPGFERNPLGKGHEPIHTSEGPIHPLPNVELPGQPITSMHDRPEPAGLGPVDPTWPQRFSKTGTYDAEWLRDLSPGLAKDLDWSVFNLAPEDQQQEALFRGDEPFLVHGMHPQRPRLEGRLPGIAVRCFLNVRAQGGEALREVPMGLTTVWLFPHAERFLSVFHGRQEIEEEDAGDVFQAVVAAERLREPRPVEHYEQVLTRRLDPERGALQTLRDGDLLPELSPAEDEPARAMVEMEELTATQGLRQKYQRRRQELEIEKARALVASQGLDPEVYGPPPLPPEPPQPSPDELPELVETLERNAERLKAAMEKNKEEGRTAMRDRLTAEGLDADAILAEIEQAPVGPPRFSAVVEIGMLRARAAERRRVGSPLDPLDRLAADPEHHLMLVETEDRMREGYRQMAHQQGAALRLEGEEAARLRAGALEVLAERGSLARQDLTGFDLSNLDLRGADLAGAWLESANLSRASLEGANLSEAVLARADLTDADLSGANLRRANLGLAQLVGTRANRAEFSEAILDGALVNGASFRDARAESATLDGVQLQVADMSGVVLRGANLLRLDLRGLRFSGADLTGCVFLEADVRGVDFHAATLEGTTFLNTRGEGAAFSEARMANVRFLQGCAFPRTDFRGAVLERANLRGSDLAGSDFSGSNLEGADLSECELTGALIAGANCREARFVTANLFGARLAEANLMNGLLQRANLSGADLRGTNLFEADLARALMDAATNLDGANLKRARLQPELAPG